MFFSLIVVLAFELELLLAAPVSRAGVAGLFARLQTRISQRFGSIALAALVIVFGLELAIIARAVDTLFAYHPWNAQLPIPIMWVYPGDLVAQIYRSAFAAVSLLEAGLLTLFLVAMYGRPWRHVDTIVSIAATVKW